MTLLFVKNLSLKFVPCEAYIKTRIVGPILNGTEIQLDPWIWDR